MINVLYEDNHMLVIEKPINVPTQKDNSQDLDLLSILKEYIKKKYNKPGNVYLGLVHRLDRPVGGIMVFAKTSKCASRLSEQIRNHQFEKSYYAVVSGLIEKEGVYIDYLSKNKKNNIVEIDKKSGKKAILSFKRIAYKNNLSLVNINLQTGRPHQIRVQFSSRNHPLYGDHKYNKKCALNSQIALFSHQISFFHPISKKKVVFSLELPSFYPFNLFKDNKI